MLILSQDRDMLINLQRRLLYFEVIEIANSFSVNLMQDEIILGTYDSLHEAMYEFHKILKCKSNYYVMGGYDFEEDY